MREKIEEFLSRELVLEREIYEELLEHHKNKLKNSESITGTLEDVFVAEYQAKINLLHQLEIRYIEFFKKELIGKSKDYPA
ncbi:hypothetical protein LC087_00125 [Bacillus carboniphilus]|uniref:Uncharacterized protein n=1 Tax=Bacillus carboniphilus TaxID=86663 RepID=A0ABY9JVD3_9BACI|nr:hypothetical protein [Bacillus carboniphilus]WLR42698.1 hypothetical protein LC087_00125 [Bacillus carboniphilus]